MVIFLINWRILPSKSIDAFLEKWKTQLQVKNADGLAGKFLSRVKDPAFFLNTSHGNWMKVQKANIGTRYIPKLLHPL
jgi:hypothetical protein